MSSIQDPAKSNSTVKFAAVILLVIGVIAAGTFFIISKSPSKPSQAASAYNKVTTDIKVDYKDGQFTLSSDNTRKDTPHADLYEDYACPHCAELSKATDEAMIDAIENGDLTVTIKTLAFLDRKDVSHSAPSMAGAIAAAETGDADMYWNYRNFMMLNQETVYKTWQSSLPDSLREAGFDESIIKAGESKDAVDKARNLASDNQRQLEKIGDVATPTVVVDGKQIPGDKLSNWVEEAKESK